MSYNTRNSTIEILRMIAMFAIVLHHYCLHGGMWLNQTNDVSSFIITAASSWGKWGVDVFILITGYFLSQKKNVYELYKLIPKFYIQVWTTSIICLLAYILYTKFNIGIKEIIKSILPIGYGTWWFATGYFVLLLLSPFINIMILNLTKKQHSILIISMLSIWSFSIFLPGTEYAYSTQLSLFIMLYIISAYIRMHINIKQSKKLVVFSLILFFLMPFCTVITQLLSSYAPILFSKKMYLVSERSPLTISAAIVSFLTVLSMKKTNIFTINKLAASTFGIYLFSDNFLIRQILWVDFLNTKSQFYSQGLLFLMLASVFLIYIFSLILEMIRQQLIQKPIVDFTYKFFK